MKNKLHNFLRVALIIVSFAVAGNASAQSPIISTFAGTSTEGYSGDGGPASAANLNYPTGVTVDGSGNIYISDGGNAISGGDNARIRKVSPSGIISTIAGNGVNGFSGDGGPATAAELYNPMGIAVDGTGNVYICDANNSCVRMVNTLGIISTIAGIPGTVGSSGNGGPATAAKVNYPAGIAVDGSGNVYIADVGNNCIRMVNTLGIISTIAGNGSGGYSGDGGAATAAKLNSPQGVSIDVIGNIYIADTYNDAVRMVNTSGTITTIAGGLSEGYGGDGGPATAAYLFSPAGVSVDVSGNIYIAEYKNQRIRYVNTSGIISTIAGNGTYGYSGDGGSPTDAELNHPQGVVTDANGKVYVADFQNSRVRVFSAPVAILSATLSGTASLCAGSTATLSVRGTPNAGITLYPTGTFSLNGSGLATYTVRPASTTTYSISLVSLGDSTAAGMGNAMITVSYSAVSIINTFAGNGTAGYSGDGGAATAAMIGLPIGVAIDGSGNVYISDYNSFVIRKVSPSGIISTVAGNGVSGFSGDGGAATAAELYNPLGIAVDGAGNLYISDAGNFVVRMVNTSGIISTIAGIQGAGGFSGNGGAATAAQLNSPFGVAVDGSGNVYIADAGNNCIRIVNTSGIISTFAGNGTAGYTGDAGPATAARLHTPKGVAVDAIGNIYIADGINNAIRMVNTSGIITTIAGGYTTGYGGDGGPATSAHLNNPLGVSVNASGDVYIADTYNLRIRMVNTSGVIRTIAGNGTAGYRGDGGSPTAAELYKPAGVVTDASGNVYFSDGNNARVRIVSGTMLAPTATITGTATICTGSIDTLSVTGTPYAGITLYPSGSFTLSGSGTATYMVSPAATTTYSISLVTLNCSAQPGSGSAVVTVSVSAAPVATITGTASMCAGSIATLSVTGTPNAGITLYPSGTFSLNGSGMATYTVSPAVATTYSLSMVTLGCGFQPGSGIAVVTIINSPIISTIAGNGTLGYSGDGGAATAGALNSPNGVAVDGSGNVYIADYNSNRIRKINSSGIISTFAGNGTSAYSGDGGAATAATLNHPMGVAVDGAGNVYIADNGNHRIRIVNSGGIISTFAGNGTGTYGGDGGAATAGALHFPYGIAVDGTGNVYIADQVNRRVRKVNSSGIITTFAGTGAVGYSGDGGPATAGRLSVPYGVAVDGAGNVYIADANNNAVRKVNSNGIISTIAGNGTAGYSGDGGSATVAQLSRPTGVAVDGSGNLYIVDYNNNSVRKVNSSGIISPFVGNATAGFSGDGGMATAGTLNQPLGVAVDGNDNVYISDYLNFRIRKVGGDFIPHPATITGPSTICAGSGVMLSNTTTAGTWNSTSVGVASVDATGNVYGVSAGSATISYAVTGVCGVGVATATVTVTSVPTITTTVNNELCYGGSSGSITTTVSGGTPGYSYLWNTTATTSGISSLPAGIYTVGITDTNGCITSGNYLINQPAMVTATVTGTATICSGSSTTLTISGTPGATIIFSSGGSFTLDGMGAGTYTVAPTSTTIYSITSVSLGDCNQPGSGSAIVTIIYPLSTPTVTGASAICTGSTASYSATGSAGGTWSLSGTSVASVSATGVITPLAAGVNTVVYTNTNFCSIVSAQKVFSVITTPVHVAISGTFSLCPASVATFTASVAGGNWTSSAAMTASVTSTTGIVTGRAAGSTIILYTMPADVCGAAVTSTVTLTVNPNPSAGTLSGATGVCTAGTGTVTSTVSGGVWSSGTPSLATVSSNTITGVSAGIDVIAYTVTNLGCSASVTRSITVTGSPTVGTIAFPSTMCLGSTASISCIPAGGTWSVSSSAIIAIGAPCHAYAVGVATVYYTVVNTCHSTVSPLVVTVITTPTVSAIGGNIPLCTSSTLNLTDATSGGMWISFNTVVAIVSGGVVSPVTTGTAAIIYSVTNACGSASVAATVTVTATPVVATISGSNTVCSSGTTALIASPAGGTWASSAAGIVSVSTTGTIRGIASGSGFIYYTMPGNICGAAQTATVSVTVIAPTTAGTITGISLICNGSSILFTESTSGGTWSSSNALAASVDGSGNVLSVGVGGASIIYSVTGACGSASATYSVSVIPTPVAATISGTSSLCTTGNATLTASVAGGTWLSTIPTVATISSTGAIHGLTVGPDIIAYTLPASSCSPSLTTTYTVTVVSGIAGVLSSATTVCQNAVTTFTVTGAGGIGIWTTVNGNTSVTATGANTCMVTGVAGGISTVMFTVNNACGTASVTRAITVNPLPTVAPITIGATTLCKGVTTPISDANLGGHWSVSDATILLLGSPLRAGSVAGTAVLFYAITNTCGVTTQSVTVTVTSCPGAARDIEGSSTTAQNTTSDVVKVFPNPSTGMLFIEASMKVDAKLSSIDGRLLIDQKDVTEINMNNLANGIYFINVYDNATGLLLKTDRVVKSGK